ncbi:3-phosphoshikimate 1-carboxyvinyltransferase [Horticoccus luteus]|uniref:3-phosphoshikimate 1-carboxyvinyltransferase n=1 Tax=Horticoccus luteus TaxID=2862869 RepID=A0A8F9TU61_9BACT|nr:3-phosphoshikimate 1-carboxyvinyltransferase [Horticoccus luteus]QYM78185.1 3-phosphoshikimate 1-carboxyvinyltransferase [Horticoccus luteus]
MTFPDLLPIQPFTRPVQGAVTLPGSKSLTNRALLLAALCDQPVTLTGALFSEDTTLMAAALRQLGFTVETNADAGTARVAGQENAFQSTAPVDLFVGLAGTAARFLTALCAAAPRGVYRLDGVPQMRKRPMKPLLDALRALGADIRCPGEEGFFPLEIHAAGLRGGSVAVDASESSQLLSALLMVAPLARGPVDVTLPGRVRWTFVEMTFRLMAEFGVKISPHEKTRFALSPARYVSSGDYAIEPDASAASYFQALPLVVGGELTFPGLRPPGEGLQGDSAFAGVLTRVRARPPGATLDEDFHEISDTFLTLAAIAPLLGGPTRISGIAHTRKQETDRVAGMARELTRLGQHVIESDDALEIHPRPLRTDTTIETYGDHRFAMSFGILGCHDLHRSGRPWLTVRDPACCTKTFPHFFELLAELRKKSLSA